MGGSIASYTRNIDLEEQQAGCRDSCREVEEYQDSVFPGCMNESK